MRHTLSLLGLLFFFSVAHACGHSADTGSARLVFFNKDTVYDFSGIRQGDVAANTFEIRNTGSAALRIQGMKCESPNVSLSWTTHEIKPGKKGVITVTYTASGDIGTFSHDIYITSNATSGPYPFLHVKGAIIPGEEGSEPSQTKAPNAKANLHKPH